MRTLYKHTKAFTMIELVFVIVVLGILAALALPRMDRDLRQEAADNILSAIRYTQQLALNDDKTDPFDHNWQQKLWTIRFQTDGSFYTISSNNEAAIDPFDGKYIYSVDNTIDNNESPNIFLAKKYGINNITFAGGCNAAEDHIAFDNLGRPHNGIEDATNDYSKYMGSNCNMTISFTDGSAPLILTITKETGHAFIIGQESL